ncbi:MAG: hypothetical protein ABIH89_03135 [Elusimicrobiota bacterium]
MKKYLIPLMIIFSVAICRAAIGLGTKFGSIVMEKVTTGRVYDLQKLRGMPYIIVNSGTGKGQVSVEVIPPVIPKKGYEAIPDPTWIQVLPNLVELNSKEEFPCNVILTLPDDDSLQGRHFHAVIRAQTVTEGFYGAAVVNNVFFSVGVPGPEEVQKAKSEKILQELNYDADPKQLFLKVPAGRKVNILKELKKSVKLINKGTDKLDLRVSSIKNVMKYPVLPGYEFTPDMSFIYAEPHSVKVKSYRIEDVMLYADIPEEYRGRKFMFLLAVSPDNDEMSFIQLYVRVYIEVE